MTPTGEQAVVAPHTYDTVIVSDNATAHLGDLHVHVQVEQLSQLGQLLYTFERNSGSRVDYQQCISHLDAVSIILLQIGQIHGDAHNDDHTLLQSLQLTVSVTLDFVQEQARSLRLLLGRVNDNLLQAGSLAASHSSITSPANEAVRALNHYLNGQLLLLNTTLQLLQRYCRARNRSV